MNVVKQSICMLVLFLLSGCSLAAGKPAPVSAAAGPMHAPDPTPAASGKEYLQYGFVSIGEHLDHVILEVRYYTDYNFVGARIDGYQAPVALLTIEAADALKTAAALLYEQGYILKIYDGYRPQRAVDHFVRWGADLSDQRMKRIFYPDIDKDKLFDGYIARKSGHSRGSTVDLTIVEAATGREVDMGSPFDLLGKISNHGTELITPGQTENRNILKDAMEQAGFKPYANEWWHYTLIDEPYPDTYFDFPVE